MTTKTSILILALFAILSSVFAIENVEIEKGVSTELNSLEYNSIQDDFVNMEFNYSCDILFYNWNLSSTDATPLELVVFGYNHVGAVDWYALGASVLRFNLDTAAVIAGDNQKEYHSNTPQICTGLESTFRRGCAEYHNSWSDGGKEVLLRSDFSFLLSSRRDIIANFTIDDSVYQTKYRD